MRNRPDFHYWMDMYSTVKKNSKGKLGIKETYEILIAKFAKNKDGATMNSALGELGWHQHGKPYYKVWPQMAQALSETNIDIDARYLHLPFPAYEIRLAKDSQFRENDQSPTLRAMLVIEERQQATDRDWTLGVHYQLDGDMAENYMGWFFAMPIRSGVILEQQVHETFITHSTKYADGYTPSEEFCRRIVRLAVSVAFFGLNQHELIMPDLPRRFETRYHEAKQNKESESEAKKLLDKAKRMGHFGWRVGSEIDLPTPYVEHKTVDPAHPPSRQLQFGHIRRGHLRLQPYGPKDKPSHYDLIFLSPTVVRPDLPLQDMRGFRIRDRIMSKMPR